MPAPVTPVAQHLSTDIFRLASECGLPLQPGEITSVTDDAFLSFRDRYLAWSGSRDAAVHRYLRDHPKFFRVLLPYTPRVLSTAMQVAWYTDELVTRDPLFGFLEPIPHDIEKAKSSVCLTLQILSRCHELISAGYLLLYGSPLFPRGDTVPDEIVQISKGLSVRAALEKAARYGFSERLDDNGTKVRVYQIELDAGGLVGMRIEKLPPGSTHTVAIQVGEQLPDISREALLEKVGDLGPVENLFARETQKALGAAKAAARLGAAVLFDRDVDSVILESAAIPLNDRQQIATTQVLNAVVPYLAGVPPENLYQLRRSVPNAFLDFRGKIHGVVEQAINDGVESVAEVKARMDREVSPAILALDAEATAEARRGRIVGYGAPAAVVTGILTGSMAGLDPSLWLGLAAALAPIKAAADYQAADVKQVASPFYFLWKARRG